MPQFITHDNFITLSGQGDAGENGGRCGDLFININEIEHELFKRREFDLYIKKDVEISDLVLGKEVKIPLLFGEVDMRIPPGSQPYTVFRISEKGLKNKDLYVELNLQIPQFLTDEQKGLFEKLREIEKLMNFKEI